MRTVIFVVGENCSGKTTWARHCKAPLRKHIEMGDLVRQKYETQDRVFDADLDKYLVEETREIIHTSNRSHFVITGVRQVSLIKELAKLFDKVNYTYLVVPREILKERFLQRAAKKDSSLSFEKVIEGDNTLGMKELQHYLLTEVKCDFEKRY